MAPRSERSKSTPLCPYPDRDAVEDLDREALAFLYRFLPSPADTVEAITLDRILDRFRELGGWSAALSKRVGWAFDPARANAIRALCKAGR